MTRWNAFRKRLEDHLREPEEERLYSVRVTVDTYVPVKAASPMQAKAIVERAAAEISIKGGVMSIGHYLTARFFARPGVIAKVCDDPQDLKGAHEPRQYHP